MADREGFWISPAGESIPVYEHCAYMRMHPKPFGITKKQAEGMDDMLRIAGAREDYLLHAISRGWIRVRGYGTYTAFDVAVFDDDAIWRIKKHLQTTKTWPNEKVIVNEHRCKKGYDETANFFLSDKATEYARNPKRKR